MEAAITAALIGAGVKLFEMAVERWDPSVAADAKQKRVREWAAKNYDKIAKPVTDNSMHLLEAAEYGDNFSVRDFRNLLHPKLTWSHDQLDILDGELHYRVEYLASIGLLESGFREYRISRLGAAFVSEARSRHGYSKVLKKKS